MFRKDKEAVKIAENKTAKKGTYIQAHVGIVMERFQKPSNVFLQR